MVPLRVKNSAQAADISGGGHGQQQHIYISQPQRKDPQFLSFLARSSILSLYGTLEYSCRPEKRFRQASLHHTLKALWLRHSVKMITSQVQFQIAKLKFRQYQNTTFFRHFAKFNARQIFPLYGMSPVEAFATRIKIFDWQNDC